MKKRDLTVGSIPKSILIIAIPTMLSAFLQFGYNIIDLFFVGKISPEAISGVGTATFFLGFGIAISTIPTVGVGIKTAQAIGANDMKKFGEYMNAGLLMTSILAVVSALVFFVFAPNLIQIFKLDNNSTYEYALTYLRIGAITMLFGYFNSVFIRVFSSLGISEKALIISAIGIIVNISLDPIFIFVFDLKVAGAAYATLLSNIFTFSAFIIYNHDKFLYRFKIKVRLKHLKTIFNIGAPYGIQRIFFTAITLKLGTIVSLFGDEAIAAQRIGGQIETLTLFMVGSFVGSMNAYTGQNFGAEQYTRIKRGYTVALKLAISIAFSTSLLFLIAGEQLISLFTDDIYIIEIGNSYLRIIAIGQVFAALEMVSNGLYAGLSLSYIPATISVIFTLLRIPLALYLIKIYEVNGVFLAIVMTSIIKGGVSYGIYKFNISRKIGTKILYLEK